jgi:hypothetical protein
MARSMTLLRSYMEQRGLFARLARELRLDPSYISRVANGERLNEKISDAIAAELQRMQTVRLRVSKNSGKRKPAAPA